MSLKFKLMGFFIFIGQICAANMASPIIEGTSVSTVFSSKDINILSESIAITIDKYFYEAKYMVEYTISSEVSGTQIPLLFLSQDYKNNFSVWFDGQLVSIQEIPEEYLSLENDAFAGFSNLANKEALINWANNAGFRYNLNDLKYFEIDITEGTHKVRVKYTANVWIDQSGWISEYSFRYSLLPAKYWKSFNNLYIKIEQEGPAKKIKTNLGVPIEGEIGQVNNWAFKELPSDFIEISFKPKPNKFAKILLDLQPLRITLFIGFCLFFVHFLYIKNYRKRHLFKKYSIAVLIGSLLVPIMTLMSYMYLYYFIDFIIGDMASERHGYIFLIFGFYPLFMPIYWLAMWLIDKQIKRNLQTKQGG